MFGFVSRSYDRPTGREGRRVITTPATNAGYDPQVRDSYGDPEVQERDAEVLDKHGDTIPKN